MTRKIISFLLMIALIMMFSSAVFAAGQQQTSRTAGTGCACVCDGECACDHDCIGDCDVDCDGEPDHDRDHDRDRDHSCWG